MSYRATEALGRPTNPGGGELGRDGNRLRGRQTTRRVAQDARPHTYALAGEAGD